MRNQSSCESPATAKLLICQAQGILRAPLQSHISKHQYDSRHSTRLTWDRTPHYRQCATRFHLADQHRMVGETTMPPNRFTFATGLSTNSPAGLVDNMENPFEPGRCLASSRLQPVQLLRHGSIISIRPLGVAGNHPSPIDASVVRSSCSESETTLRPPASASPASPVGADTHAAGSG